MTEEKYIFEYLGILMKREVFLTLPNQSLHFKRQYHEQQDKKHQSISETECDNLCVKMNLERAKGANPLILVLIY